MLNSSRVWLDREIAAFAKRLPEGAVVLDAGAGDQQYRRYFAHCQYEAADFEKVDKSYAKSTYVCDLSSIPVEDQRFHAVIFTQVMEHLPEPLAVLGELQRVLKTGGLLFYSGPLWYREHEIPYDFYRYTQFGVRYLLEASGFESDEIHWLEGSLMSVAKQLDDMKRCLPRSLSPYGGINGLHIYLLTMVMLLLGRITARRLARADAKMRHTKSGYPINYFAIARRK